MTTRSTDLADTVRREAADELSDALARIHHCVGQLTDEQLWWRAAEQQNSIGNLLLHLAGNIRQWIVSGAGGQPDTRQRAAEFAQRDPIPRQQLLERLDQAVQQALDVIRSVDDERLVMPLEIQRFSTTGFGAILHSVAHFRGHTQEIIYMTRTQLGQSYQFAWTPGPGQE